MRPPLPPFTKESAAQKVRAAEDGWNGKNAEKVSLAYSEDSVWRNRDTFVSGRAEIVEFLTNKWNTERDYRLVKELFAFTDNRIAVRYAYEYQNELGQWFRAYGNENWEFNAEGLMTRRYASINDLAIQESERLLVWEEGPRPQDYASLSELGL
ncbi:nuclear transport factor 2 family protein [Alteromonas sp. 5E99-2]|uniref:nuclear transport factor 2 family protein n=1 Tax=Alteromonas sp. 5E99-2 TaxID=2817683 RepID=UPI001A9A0434|nr:nuclear transport factor 2 family protein [Alteromonas sp. 5E99-2]MBO1254650.1 nuclear transport factor 2 family protein [Alteromonas sp. 5E99-2]